MQTLTDDEFIALSWRIANNTLTAEDIEYLRAVIQRNLSPAPAAQGRHSRPYSPPC